MEFLNYRISSGDESTLCVCHDISGDPKFECFILEDQYNEPKIRGETRIPAGRYEIKFRNEGGMIKRYKKRFPWHEGMLWLQGVPDFEWVYIHVGNKDDDTDGCLLVGDGQISNREERGQVTSSVSAYKRIYGKIARALNDGERVFITIEDYA